MTIGHPCVLSVWIRCVAMLSESFTPILLAAQQGQAWAFERLWHDLGPLVTGYLRLQGAVEPDDLTSETFIGVFTGISRFSGTEESFRSWVLVIAHRRLLDQRRRLSRQPPVLDDSTEALSRVPGGEVEGDALEALADEDVRRLLTELSPDQRSVLTLRILADLTIEQIAEVMERRPGAIKALQRRGLSKLREHFSETGVPL